MFRGKLWKKLFITYLVVMLLIFLAINYPMKIWVRNKMENRELSKMKAVADTCISIYQRNGNQNLAEILGNAEDYSGYSFWLISEEGIVKVDTFGGNAGLNVLRYSDKFFSKNEIKNTNLNGLLHSQYMVYNSHIHTGPAQGVIFSFFQNYTYVNDIVEEYIYILNMAGIIFAVLSLIVMLLYGIYYTWVLRYMIKMTASYADGKFEGRRKRRKFSDENQELANAIDYMAEKNEGLVEYQKTFVANISHDFRSPLTSIRGYTVAMKDGTIPYEMQGKYLDIILFETDRLAGLTQNLLDLNEFDSGAIKLNLTNFNLCAMIKQSAATFEAICASKKLKLRLIFAEKEIWVKADKQKIQQVLHNLIDNAIKFSNEDSRVEVTVTARDGKVYVSVRDYGIGIPKDAINQVWERFYKTDLSRGKDKKGTGLGLSITKQIINAHDEKIVVDSTVGEGTEFTFTLTESEKNG